MNNPAMAAESSRVEKVLENGRGFALGISVMTNFGFNYY
jgi:hypothetical protein